MPTLLGSKQVLLTFHLLTATSALDQASEAQVQRAINKLLPGRTAVIVAHRLGTVKSAHNILVMQEGRIVESGTYQELEVSGTFFRKLIQAQESLQPSKVLNVPDSEQTMLPLEIPLRILAGSNGEADRQPAMARVTII